MWDMWDVGFLVILGLSVLGALLFHNEDNDPPWAAQKRSMERFLRKNGDK
jgi:hypothetical protein